MRPKRWIDPEQDTQVRDGDFRIVRLKCGRVRATKWRTYNGSTHGYYADSNGEGVGSPLNEVVAVGVTWEKTARKRSGPSGRNLVPQRAVRIPDDLWSRLGDVAASHRTDRNTVINQLVADYCSK